MNGSDGTNVPTFLDIANAIHGPKRQRSSGIEHIASVKSQEVSNFTPNISSKKSSTISPEESVSSGATGFQKLLSVSDASSKIPVKIIETAPVVASQENDLSNTRGFQEPNLTVSSMALSWKAELRRIFSEYQFLTQRSFEKLAYNLKMKMSPSEIEQWFEEERVKFMTEFLTGKRKRLPHQMNLLETAFKEAKETFLPNAKVIQFFLYLENSDFQSSMITNWFKTRRHLGRMAGENIPAEEDIGKPVFIEQPVNLFGKPEEKVPSWFLIPP